MNKITSLNTKKKKKNSIATDLTKMCKGKKTECNHFTLAPLFQIGI